MQPAAVGRALNAHNLQTVKISRIHQGSWEQKQQPDIRESRPAR